MFYDYDFSGEQGCARMRWTGVARIGVGFNQLVIPAARPDAVRDGKGEGLSST